MGNTKLVRLLPGQELDGIIEDFIEIYGSKPFETLLILPNPAIRDRIKGQLVGRGIPVFGASVCTLDEFTEYCFDTLNRTDSRLDNYSSELVLLRVLEDNKQQLGLFNGAWTTAQAMVPEIKAFLETIQDYIVDYPKCLESLQARRSDQLDSINHLYKGYLASNRLVDHGRMIEWVISAIASGFFRFDHIIIYGLYEPKPLEKELIHAVSNASNKIDYYIPYVRGCKAFSDDGSWLNAQAVDEISMAENEVAVTSLSPQGSRRHSEKIVKGVFRDPLEEIRAVAREIRSLISSGVEPGEISIILPLRSKSGPLVKEVLEDHGIPFNLYLTTPISESPLIMSVFRLLEMVDSDYDRDAVVDLLGSPYLTCRFYMNDEELTLNARDVSEVSLNAGIIGGKGSWFSSLRSLAIQIREEMDDAEDEKNTECLKQSLQRIELVEVGLRKLFDLLSSIKGDLTVRQRTDALRKILCSLELLNNLEKDDDEIYEKEVHALNTLLSTLDAMEMGEFIAPSGQIELSDFIARLRLLASTEGFHESDDNRDAVQVSGLRASYLMRYDYVFIIGMIDGDIPYLEAGNAFIR